MALAAPARVPARGNRDRLVGEGQAVAGGADDAEGQGGDGTFLAKWQLLSTAIASGQWLWVPVVGAGTLLASAYVLRLLGHAFGTGDRTTPVLAHGLEEVPALLLALTATAVLGLGAAAVWGFVAPGAYAPGIADALVATGRQPDQSAGGDIGDHLIDGHHAQPPHQNIGQH